jgi:hypothetical protein
MVLLVHQTSLLKNGDEVVKVTVDIPDRDNSFRRLLWSLRWSGAR